MPEPESAEPVAVTYQDLFVRVNEFAALLRDFAGLKAGDRVTMHMPMVPELPITMLACARLGVIHSEVFGGFSGDACGDQVADSEQPGADHDGRLLPQRPNSLDHKANADVAIDEAEKRAEGGQGARLAAASRQVLARRRPWSRAATSSSTSCCMAFRGQRVDPVSMPAEAPLFLMYTSGTTGQPKGGQHSIGGYLAYVTGTSKYIQDIHPEDVYWCMADIGWITGHSYIVYGPLALGDDQRDLRGGARLIPTPGGPGGSPSGSTSTSSTPRPRPSGCCGSSGPTSPPSTTTTSST